MPIDEIILNLIIFASVIAGLIFLIFYFSSVYNKSVTESMSNLGKKAKKLSFSHGFKFRSAEKGIAVSGIYKNHQFAFCYGNIKVDPAEVVYDFDYKSVDEELIKTGGRTRPVSISADIGANVLFQQYLKKIREVFPHSFRNQLTMLNGNIKSPFEIVENKHEKDSLRLFNRPKLDKVDVLTGNENFDKRFVCRTGSISFLRKILTPKITNALLILPYVHIIAEGSRINLIGVTSIRDAFSRKRDMSRLGEDLFELGQKGLDVLILLAESIEHNG